MAIYRRPVEYVGNNLKIQTLPICLCTPSLENVSRSYVQPLRDPLILNIHSIIYSPRQFYSSPPMKTGSRKQIYSRVVFVIFLENGQYREQINLFAKIIESCLAEKLLLITFSFAWKKFNFIVPFN